MFPLRDNVPSRRFPVVTLVIVVVNVLLFLFEVMLGQNATALTESFGVVPARLIGNWYSPVVLFTLFSSMYLHGGWVHLIGNMWYLWILATTSRTGWGGWAISFSIRSVVSPPR